MISQPQYHATLAGLGAWWANDATAPLVIVPQHVTDWLLALVIFGDTMLRGNA